MARLDLCAVLVRILPTDRKAAVGLDEGFDVRTRKPDVAPEFTKANLPGGYQFLKSPFRDPDKSCGFCGVEKRGG